MGEDRDIDEILASLDKLLNESSDKTKLEQTQRKVVDNQAVSAVNSETHTDVELATESFETTEEHAEADGIFEENEDIEINSGVFMFTEDAVSTDNEQMLEVACSESDEVDTSLVDDAFAIETATVDALVEGQPLNDDFDEDETVVGSFEAIQKQRVVLTEDMLVEQMQNKLPLDLPHGDDDRERDTVDRANSAENVVQRADTDVQEAEVEDAKYEDIESLRTDGLMADNVIPVFLESRDETASLSQQLTQQAEERAFEEMMAEELAAATALDGRDTEAISGITASEVASKAPSTDIDIQALSEQLCDKITTQVLSEVQEHLTKHLAEHLPQTIEQVLRQHFKANLDPHFGSKTSD